MTRYVTVFRVHDLGMRAALEIQYNFGLTDCKITDSLDLTDFLVLTSIYTGLQNNGFPRYNGPFPAYEASPLNRGYNVVLYQNLYTPPKKEMIFRSHQFETPYRVNLLP